MKNIWRKMRDCWLDFWEDDELDMDKKHLSQHDKCSLLYGGFMIEVATFGLFSIGIIAGNIWTNHQNQKDKNIQCLSPAKKYKLYKSSINKSIHFVQRSLSSGTRGQRVTAQLNLSRE